MQRDYFAYRDNQYIIRRFIPIPEIAIMGGILASCPVRWSPHDRNLS